MEIQLVSEKVKLKGNGATEYLEQMFSSMQVQSPEAIQLVVKNILDAYGIDINTVEIKIKVTVKDQEYEYKY